MPRCTQLTHSVPELTISEVAIFTPSIIPIHGVTFHRLVNVRKFIRIIRHRAIIVLIGVVAHMPLRGGMRGSRGWSDYPSLTKIVHHIQTFNLPLSNSESAARDFKTLSRVPAIIPCDDTLSSEPTPHCVAPFIAPTNAANVETDAANGAD